MLKGIDPLLSPELLHALAAMGHGDQIALVDCHFPAVSLAQRLVRLDGVTLPGAARAVLSLLPIDTLIDEPVAGVRMDDSPDVVPEVQAEVFDAVRASEGREVGFELVERVAFYDRVRKAFVVVITGENRPYGNVIFTKGLVL